MSPWVGDIGQCTDDGNFSIHCGAAPNCMTHDQQTPDGTVIDQAYCDQPSLPFSQGRREIAPFNHTTRGDSDYGPMLYVVSERPLNTLGVYGESDPLTLADARLRSPGFFYAGDDSAYGPRLTAFSAVSCMKDVHPFENLLDESLKCVRESDEVVDHLCQGIRLDAALHDEGGGHTAYGARKVWLVGSPCRYPENVEDHLYYVNLFGHECWYCPWLLLSFDLPCFTCSWNIQRQPAGANCAFGCAFGENVYGYCPEALNNNVEEGDDPLCIAQLPPPNVAPENAPWYRPDWRYGCAALDPLSPHYCEECTWARMIGIIVNYALSASHASRRIPLRAVRDESMYGCGSFGFQLPGPLRLDMSGVPSAPEDELYEECGGELVICGEGEDEVRYHPNIRARLDPDGYHRITKATVMFRQAELCNQLNEQDNACPQNPCHNHPDGCGAGNPYAPSSSMMVHVAVEVEIGIGVLVAWNTGLNNSVCDCPNCQTNVSKTVTCKGTANMVIPWAELYDVNWLGYVLGLDGIYYPEGGFQSGSCAGDQVGGIPSPPGICMNPFVNSGKVTDYELEWPLGGGAPFRVYPPPPKNSPSFVIRDKGPDQYWCPPAMKWTWSVEDIVPESQLTYAAQCWDVEAARNHSCVDGNDAHDQASSERYECTKLECRRGCDIGVAERDLVSFDGEDCWELVGTCGRKQPCQCRPLWDGAKPWSMGQCTETDHRERGWHEDI